MAKSDNLRPLERYMHGRNNKGRVRKWGMVLEHIAHTIVVDTTHMAWLLYFDLNFLVVAGATAYRERS